MPGTLVLVLAFAAGFFAIFAVNLVLTDLFKKDLQQIRRRMETEAMERERARARQSLQSQPQSTALSQLAEEAFRENASSTSWWERLDDVVGQAGLQLKPRQLFASSVLAAVIAGVMGWLLLGRQTQGAALAVVGALAPLAYVQWKRRQRLDALRAQLPDALELMSRTLRAGQTISQAMYAVAQEFKPPLSHEFGYCYEQQNLGLSPEVALRDLARRTGLLEVRIFVLGLLVHRQTGGNLTQLLDNLSTVIRERYKLRGRMQALTAEGRMQALVLLALPPLMFLVMLVTNRPYAMQHFEHPQLLLATLASMTVGAIWIRNIVNFDF